MIGARARFASGWAIDPPDIAVDWPVSATEANCYGGCGGAAEVSLDGSTWDTFGVFAGGSTLKTTITASNIEVVGTATKGGGSMRVYLDGVLRATVSERGVGEIALLRANFGKVSAHTVKLVAVASSGHRATFDAILALRQAD